jgi:hypothetical protein
VLSHHFWVRDFFSLIYNFFYYQVALLIFRVKEQESSLIIFGSGVFFPLIYKILCQISSKFVIFGSSLEFHGDFCRY